MGRAELLRARTAAAAGDSAGAAEAAERATVAQTNGNGPDNRITAAARALRDSLRTPLGWHGSRN